MLSKEYPSSEVLPGENPGFFYGAYPSRIREERRGHAGVLGLEGDRELPLSEWLSRDLTAIT